MNIQVCLGRYNIYVATLLLSEMSSNFSPPGHLCTLLRLTCSFSHLVSPLGPRLLQFSTAAIDFQGICYGGGDNLVLVNICVLSGSH